MRLPRLCRPSGAGIVRGRVPGLTPWAKVFRASGAGLLSCSGRGAEEWVAGSESDALSGVEIIAGGSGAQALRPRSGQARVPVPQSGSGQPVEEFVVGAGEGQGPGVAAAEAEGRAGKRDAGKRVVVGVAADYAGEFCAHPRGGGYAVACEA